MTIRSSRDGPLPSFEGRTVIVGAGAVGITMAVALARAGSPVTVLEGGPREPRADFRTANAGPLTGDAYPGLTEGRMKAFGGTTRLWGGQLGAFEPRDFERRDEAGEKLWPIPFEEFLPWIAAAYDMLGVSPEARDARAIWQRATGYDPDLGEGLTMGMNLWLKQPDFTRLFARELATLPGLEVITDCPVAALRFGEDGKAMFELALPDGPRPLARPERIVLANGTIEIGGLLMRAAATEPNCPFAANVHLGRWYFDHLHGLVGKVEIADTRAVSAMFDHVYFEGRKYGVRIRGEKAGATLNPALTPRQVAADALLLARRVLTGGGGLAAALGRAVTLARILLPLASRFVRDRRATSLFDRGTYLGIELEQYPSPNCYLVLDPDAPPENARVGVHWSLDPRLVGDLAETCERIARMFTAKGLGRIRLDPRLQRRDPAMLDALHDASHQMGGARMADSPERGVVDSDLKVFGTDSLFVAGAAVFPSGSFVNPTLTAIALGQRLAHHLADQPEGRAAAAHGLMERLVFGCSRLAGGASARASARLLHAALDAGVRTVDCAPSYGLGLAETVVGRVLRERSDVEVIAKLGSRRDPLAWPKSLLRETKRRLRPPTPRSHEMFQLRERVARYGTGDFTAEGLRTSFAIARQRLGKIDALLLHDCGPEECTRQVTAVLADLAQAAGARPGYANSALFDPETDRAFPAGCIAECAIDPRWLTGAAPPPAREGLVLHSIVPTGDWLARTDPNFAAALGKAAGLLPSVDAATARIAALYALAAVRVPRAKLVFASSHPARLDSLLAAFALIEREGLARRVADLFAVTPAPRSSADDRGGQARQVPT